MPLVGTNASCLSSPSFCHFIFLPSALAEDGRKMKWQKDGERTAKVDGIRLEVHRAFQANYRLIGKRATVFFYRRSNRLVAADGKRRSAAFRLQNGGV